MTFAPADLVACQQYAHARTGQPFDALGIIHSTPQGGGYHEGHDLLHAAGRAPEDPGSDYSYAESDRDRRGLTDAASAFDLGDGFPRFLEFNGWVVGRAQAGDPRTRDIREIIYTLDRLTVNRWDALRIRSSGDSTHLTHTHFSFFRDADGRRDRADNFLGLLTEFFEGDDMTPEEHDRLTNIDAQVNTIIRMADPAHLTVGDQANELGKIIRDIQAKVTTLSVGGIDVDALAAKIVAGVIAAHDALTVADEPVISAAVKAALRSGTG